MKKILVAVCLLAGVVPNDICALDLAPHEVSSSSDGPPMKRYFFQDAGKRITFRMDNKMTVNGTSESAAFRFTDLKSAGMTLSKSSMKPEMLFDQKNLEAYRSIARSFVTQNATDIQLEPEKTDAIAINGWTSHQFVFTYNLFGSPCRRSVTFINYSEREQLIVDISGARTDYEKTYARGYRVLNSLTELLSTTAGPT